MKKKLKQLLVLVVIFWCGSVSAADSARLLLKWYHQFQFAGFYAAVEKGFYAQEGLDVQISEGGQEIKAEVIPSVLSYEYDFAVGSLSVLDSIVENMPIVVLAQIFQQNPYAFISNQTKGIADFKSLKGKRVIINRSAGDLVYAFLSKMGVSQDDLLTVETLDPLKAIVSDRADVFFSYTSTFPYLLSSQGIIPYELKPQNYGWNFIGDTLITHRDMVSHRPDVVDRFLRASIKGWAYALDHQDELIHYIMGLRTKRPSVVTYEMLKDEAKKIEKLIARDMVEIGHIHRYRWNDLINRVCQYRGEDCSGRDFSSHFFHYERNYEQYFNISTWFSLLLFAVICISLSINLRLKRIVRKRTRQMVEEMEHRRLSEHELRMNDYAMNLALEGGGIAFFDVATPFHKMKTNEQFALQIGHAPENYHETLSHWFENIHPEDKESFTNYFDSLRSGRNVSFDGEARFAHSTGSWKWLLCRAKVVEWDGEKRPKRILGILLDIDDFKTATMRADCAGKRQCALFSAMGHEIRTPLNCMMGFAELLLDEDNLAKKQNYVREITQNGAQLLRVVSGLISIAKVEFEGVRLKRQAFAPLLILQKLRDELLRRNTSSGVNIRLADCVNLPVQLKAEEQVIIQILHYLADHLQKIVTEGDLVIKGTYSETQAQKGIFAVSFHGQHLSVNSDDLFQLFDGHWNGIDEWSSYSGRDFTLIMAKKLMDIIGGNFGITSSTEGESLFTLSFPVHRDDVNVKSDQQITQESILSLTRLCRVLVVDDDESSAILIRTILEKNGAVVEHGRDGLHAVKMLQTKNYDLIIMDIQMLGLDGVETTKIIRSRGIFTPIVALSAHLIEQFEKEAVEAGIDGFLQKPVASEDLLRTVAEFCTKNWP